MDIKFDATALAEACSAKMAAEDRCSKAMGMEVRETRPGYAVVSMALREDMMNVHDTCHGGVLFTLADTAFAHACNNGNRRTVALSCNIDFIAPCHLGDTLLATCRERHRGGRTGTYECDIHNQHGTLVAIFRGRCYQTSGTVL